MEKVQTSSPTMTVTLGPSSLCRSQPVVPVCKGYRPLASGPRVERREDLGACRLPGQSY